MKMIFFVGTSFLVCYVWNLAVVDCLFLTLPCFQVLKQEINFQQQTRFAQLRHVLIPLLLLIAMIVIGATETDRSFEKLLQREIVFKSIVGVLLVFNAVCFAIVYKETGWLRQMITDFILPGTGKELKAGTFFILL